MRSPLNIAAPVKNNSVNAEYWFLYCCFINRHLYFLFRIFIYFGSLVSVYCMLYSSQTFIFCILYSIFYIYFGCRYSHCGVCIVVFTVARHWYCCIYVLSFHILLGSSGSIDPAIPCYWLLGCPIFAYIFFRFEAK